MTKPDADPNFCDSIDLETANWPGPWGCGTVWWEVVDGSVVSHRCALSFDHVHYRDEPHVCTKGHQRDVGRRRRRWRDWLLRRPAEELPWRREPLLFVPDADRDEPGSRPTGFFTNGAAMSEQDVEAWRRRWEALPLQASDERANGEPE